MEVMGVAKEAVDKETRAGGHDEILDNSWRVAQALGRALQNQRVSD